MENILEAVIKSFHYGEDLILKDLKMSVKKGEIIVLTGLSGCGKTTLLRLLNGLIPSFYDGDLDGEIKILGKDITTYKKGELAKYIGNVFQNPKDQFFCDVVEDEIALVGENLGLDRDTLKEKVEKAMDLLGINHISKKSIFKLSGGERQKVAIAGTLIYDTDIIFFDEPSSSLDYDSIKHFSEICDVFPNGSLRNNKCKELELRTLNERELISEKEPIAAKSYIKVNKACIHQGKRTLIEDLTFELGESEIMGVIGSNGIGKSTLAKALCGLSEKYLDVSYGNKQRERLRNSYCVLQDVDAQIFLDTVENELIFCKDKNSESDLEKIREYLKDTNLWHKKTNHPQKLSGGQKQRLAIITSFLSGRKLIILDEPTSGLDYKSMKIMSDLTTEKAKEIPIIIITHDLELLFKTCHSVLMLGDNGYKKISVKGNEALIMDFMDKKGNLLKEENYVK